MEGRSWSGTGRERSGCRGEGGDAAAGLGWPLGGSELPAWPGKPSLIPCLPEDSVLLLSFFFPSGLGLGAACERETPCSEMPGLL